MRSFTFITFILCSLSCFAETIQDASQDSLKGAYLKYVPDGSYIVKVDDLGYSDKIQDALTGRMFLKNGCYVGGFKEKNPKKCEVDIDLQYLQDFLNEDFTVYDSLIYFYQHCEFSEPGSHFYYGYRWSEEDLDSLKRLFLTYLPDSTDLLDVVDLDVQDEIIEQGWLLVTRCERQEWDTKDDGECYNPNFRGAIILFKNKTGEIYKYFEKKMCLHQKADQVAFGV